MKRSLFRSRYFCLGVIAVLGALLIALYVYTVRISNEHSMLVRRNAELLFRIMNTSVAVSIYCPEQVTLGRKMWVRVLVSGLYAKDTVNGPVTIHVYHDGTEVAEFSTRNGNMQIESQSISTVDQMYYCFWYTPEHKGEYLLWCEAPMDWPVYQRYRYNSIGVGVITDAEWLRVRSFYGQIIDEKEFAVNRVDFEPDNDFVKAHFYVR